MDRICHDDDCDRCTRGDEFAFDPKLGVCVRVDNEDCCAPLSDEELDSFRTMELGTLQLQEFNDGFNITLDAIFGFALLLLALLVGILIGQSYWLNKLIGG
jgi:hypothetical protein